MTPERLKGAVIVLVALVALVGALVYGSGTDGEKDAVEILRKGAARGTLPALLVAKYDLDGSGGISLVEFPGSEKRFGVLDTSGDGQLTEQDMKAEAKGGQTADGQKPKKPGRGFVKKHDQDDDKRLSASEYPGSQQQFDALDVDGDGLLNGLEASFRPKGLGEKSKKGKKGRKGKKGQGSPGAEGAEATDGETPAPETSEPETEDPGEGGGVSEKIERKNRNPKDTLTFHSAPEDAPEEAAPTGEAEPAKEP